MLCIWRGFVYFCYRCNVYMILLCVVNCMCIICCEFGVVSFTFVVVACNVRVHDMLCIWRGLVYFCCRCNVFMTCCAFGVAGLVYFCCCHNVYMTCTQGTIDFVDNNGSALSKLERICRFPDAQNPVLEAAKSFYFITCYSKPTTTIITTPTITTTTITSPTITNTTGVV